MGLRGPKKADLQLQRDQLDASTTPSSIAGQSGQIKTIVDDWEHMTVEEEPHLLHLIFAEVRANVVDTRVELSLLVRPEWMPCLDALRVAAPDAAQVDLDVGGYTRAGDGIRGTQCGNGSPRPRRGRVGYDCQRRLGGVKSGEEVTARGTERDLALILDDGTDVASWARLHINDLPILWSDAGHRQSPPPGR